METLSQAPGVTAATPDRRGRRHAHGTLMRHADALDGCAEGSEEGAELKAIVDLIEAYEVKR